MVKVSDFVVSKHGGALLQSVIISGPGSRPEDLEKIAGVRVLLDPAIKTAFVAWLQGQQIDDAAAALSVGRSTVARLRKALGLSAKYDGSSRTKAWRDKKKAAQP
jgi:hypothetical protein